MARKYRINPHTGKLDRVLDPESEGLMDKDTYDVDKDAIIDKAESIDDGADGIKSTTSPINYYVNCDTGNNSNPGTESEPFKNIQYAVNQVPKILNHNVNIKLQDSQNYNELVSIAGFIGGVGELTIESQSGNPDDVVITNYAIQSNHGIFNVDNNSNTIRIQKVTMKQGGVRWSKCIRAFNSRLQVLYSKFGTPNNALLIIGVNASTGARVYVANCSNISSDNKVEWGIDSAVGGYISYVGEFGKQTQKIDTYNAGLITNGYTLLENEIKDLLNHKQSRNEDNKLLYNSNNEVTIEQTSSNSIFNITHPSYPYQWVRYGQVFKASSTGELTKVNLWITKIGNPGDFIIEVYRIREGYPFGNSIGSISVDGGSISSGENIFTFAIPIFISKDENYCFICRCIDADESNYYSLEIDTRNLYNNGFVLYDIEYSGTNYIKLEDTDIKFILTIEEFSSLIENGELKENLVIATDKKTGNITHHADGHNTIEGELKIKVYEQDTEPTLNADNFMAIWKDTSVSGSPDIYIIFRRGSGDQVKTLLS
ncbi:MAG: hypothetical protein JW924_03390 [Fusobacteriaceae bacterium]|nr:hypothetical protein [Fusobacteriaceae bacterium]